MKSTDFVSRPRHAWTLWAALALLPQACDGCPPTSIKTEDLKPVSFHTGLSGFTGSQGFCLQAGQVPASPYSPGPRQVLVGFDDYYAAGSGLFPCDDVRAINFRGTFRFALEPYDVIAAARLMFHTEGALERRGGGATIGSSPPKSHATTLGVGTSSPTSTLPDSDTVPLSGGPAFDIDMSTPVRDWVEKTRPNFGFVIGGPRGPINADDPPEDNDAALSWYGNFRLRIVYNPDLNPRAP